MKKSLRTSFLDELAFYGIDLRAVKGQAIQSLRHFANMPRFRKDLAEFNRQGKSSPDKFMEARIEPRFESEEPGGTASGPYFHQDLLVARRIYERKPERHLDVGSRVDGFVAHVAVFREIEIIDIRPFQTQVANIKVQVLDLSNPLGSEFISCCDSLSCLHALEHFGLGRYGDPIKFEGYREGFKNLYLMLKLGGTLYFSVPLGPQRICFNSHRVFSMRFLLEMIQPFYDVCKFSYVDDRGNLHEDVDLEGSSAAIQVDANFGCLLGCGIFELTKRQAS